MFGRLLQEPFELAVILEFVELLSGHGSCGNWSGSSKMNGSKTFDDLNG